jgi:hypothetical protein
LKAHGAKPEMVNAWADLLKVVADALVENE